MTNHFALFAAAMTATLWTSTGSLHAQAAAVETWKLPSDKPALAAGTGRELVLGQCILCHSTDYISTQPKLTKAQWQATVEKMRAKYGAPLPSDAVPAVVEFLTGAYGRPASTTPAR